MRDVERWAGAVQPPSRPAVTVAALLPSAAAMLYFEDFTPGRSFELGSVVVTEDEILEFARRYDPQPFHVDRAAAIESPYGGLIASGWHTTALYMRLWVDAVLGQSAALGSPGVEEIRWRAPVRPGDVLSGRVTVVDATPSSRTTGRGTVRLTSSMTNQDGVEVLTFAGAVLFGRRPST